jgi:hypothetical protein
MRVRGASFMISRRPRSRTGPRSQGGDTCRNASFTSCSNGPACQVVCSYVTQESPLNGRGRLSRCTATRPMRDQRGTHVARASHFLGSSLRLMNSYGNLFGFSARRFQRMTMRRLQRVGGAGGGTSRLANGVHREPAPDGRPAV